MNYVQLRGRWFIKPTKLSYCFCRVFFTLVRGSEIRGFCKKNCFRLHEEDETVDSSLSFNIRINRIAGNTLKMIGIIIQRKI